MSRKSRVSPARRDPPFQFRALILDPEDWILMLACAVGGRTDGFLRVLICAELAKRLAKAGKSMDEAVAEIKAPWNRGHGPLHLAAAAGKVETCKFLIKDLKVHVDTTGSIGKILLFSTLVRAFRSPARASLTVLAKSPADLARCGNNKRGKL